MSSKPEKKPSITSKTQRRTLEIKLSEPSRLRDSSEFDDLSPETSPKPDESDLKVLSNIPGSTTKKKIDIFDNGFRIAFSEATNSPLETGTTIRAPEDSLPGWENIKGPEFSMEKHTASIYLPSTHDEDGHPVTRVSKGGRLVVIAVADGLGGSGATQVKPKNSIEGNLETRRMAQLAARWASGVMQNLTEDDLKVLNFGDMLSGRLKEYFLLYSEKYKRIDSLIKSRLMKDYPTTLTCIRMLVKESLLNVEVYYSGDSPFFIVTPNTTYAHADYSDGTMEEQIHLGNFELKQAVRQLSKEDPCICIAASDGVLKNNLRKTFEIYINEALAQANSIQDFFQKLYDLLKRQDGIWARENDDTTLAMHLYVPEGMDSELAFSLMKKNQSKKVEEV